MRRLLLLRHAKSDWGDPGLDDRARPLNARGRAAAAAMGRALATMDHGLDLVLASPAVRVRETLGLLQQAMGALLPVREVPMLYGAASDELLALVQGCDPALRSLMLVGHNPGLHRLAASLTDGDIMAGRTDLSAKLPTGALAWIEFDVDAWRDVRVGGGQLWKYVKPRDLAAPGSAG